MSNDERFAYEVRSDWRGHLTLWRFVKGWSVLIAILAALLSLAARDVLVGPVAAIFFWPLPMIYALPMLAIAAFEVKRVRVVLARDADAWVIETETDLGTKVRRGRLSDLTCAETGSRDHGHAFRLVLVERGGRRHQVLEPGGRFAFRDTLSLARSADGGVERRLPADWGHAELLADMAARIEAFLRPSADPDAMRPLRR